MPVFRDPHEIGQAEVNFRLEGRITLGCPGIWTDEQRDAWRRVADFVHTRSTARIGMQLGHSGRKGSTKLMWEGMDEPLEADNWEVIGPSPLPYGDDCHVPREATLPTPAPAVMSAVASASSAHDWTLIERMNEAAMPVAYWYT